MEVHMPHMLISALPKTCPTWWAALPLFFHQHVTQNTHLEDVKVLMPTRKRQLTTRWEYVGHVLVREVGHLDSVIFRKLLISICYI